MRTAAKVDRNQFEVIQMLRAAGCTVEVLSQVGSGCPDLLVARSGVTVLMEVKAEKGKLNDLQKEWHEKWKGKVFVVRTPLEALEAISEAVRGKA